MDTLVLAMLAIRVRDVEDQIEFAFIQKSLAEATKPTWIGRSTR